MKGIIFTSDSVKGIIDGRKTQTRRIITPQLPKDARWMGWWLSSTSDSHPGSASWMKEGESHYRKPRYEVGDVVYVKETWADLDTAIAFKQRGDILPEGGKWNSSLYMPEKYSRIHIEITGIKAQRVQDITKEEAIAEGIKVLPLQDESDPSAWYQSAPGVYQARSAVVSYALLWDSINGKKHPWKSNPWVFAYTFKKVEEK